MAVTSGESGATGIRWAEAGDAAKHPTMHGVVTLGAQRVSHGTAEGPWAPVRTQ